MARRWAVVLLLAAAARAQEAAFVDVTVVPMDRAGVLEHRTVLVRDGRIAAIGAAGELEPPAGALVIDGRGCFLMPGLADMHVHNWYEEEHLLFLANGVTTVRNMWGKPLHRRWREEIERGERLGPELATTGDIVDGRPPVWQDSTAVATAEEARAAVAAQERAGFPEVKVYNRIPAEAYEALLAEARERGLRVTGHVPWTVGIDRVLGRQDCIEHLDGYFGPVWRWDETRAGALARRTAEAGTWNCPTLVVYRKVVPPSGAEALRARPEMRFVPPRLLATWDPATDFRFEGMRPDDFDRLRAWDVHRARFVKMLRDAGAPLLLGTDSGNPFVVAGYAVHEELDALVAAGLSPFEALSAATSGPAEYLEGDFGLVAAGRRADLLLLAGNPLEDVGHAARPLGVMVRGRWLTAADLARRLEEIAASYSRPKDRFRGMPPLPEGDLRHFDVTWNGVVVGEERFVVTGDGSPEVRVQQANDPPHATRKTAAHPLGEGARVDDTLASWATAWPLLALLEPGGEAEVPYRGGRVRVRREADEDGQRAFSNGRDGVGRFVVLFGTDGVPSGWRERMEQGIVAYRRRPK